jgi:hypothetical protein
MEGLKQERFILPSADTLERASLAGRARARKAAAATIVAGLSHAELIRIDDLIVNSSDFGMTPLAWLRNFEQAPTTANINGLLKRLRYVREIGITRDWGQNPRFPISAIHAGRSRGSGVSAFRL